MSHVENKTEDHYPYFTTKGLDYVESESNWEDRFPEKEFAININKHGSNSTGTTTPGSQVVPNYGKYITQLAANKMIGRFLEAARERAIEIIRVVESEEKSSDEKNQTDSKQNLLTTRQLFALEQILISTHGYTVFSKEVLSFILSQKECVGIKFYFCINHENKLSLVLVGVDAKGCDIGASPENCSIFDYFNDKFQSEQKADTSQESRDPSGKAIKDTENTIQSVRESTAIVEVGGPNDSKASLVSLYDVLTRSEFLPDSYSKAVKEFFNPDLLARQL